MAAQTEKPVRRAPDPEIQTLAKLDRMLADMDEKRRARCISWLLSRYMDANIRYNPPEK